MRSARLALLVLIVSALASCSGGKPSTPTSASPATPTAAISITNYTITPEISGSGRLYRASFTMNETSGRSAAIVNSIRFTLGGGTADGSPSTPIRIAAGGSAPSGQININDSAGTSNSITSIAVAIGYTDDGGRSTSVTSTASFTQPTAPVATPTPTPIQQQLFTVAGVVSEAGRGGITGVTVQVVSGTYTGRSSTTDGNGYYSIGNVRGDLRLSATKTGYATTLQSADVSKDTRFDFTMIADAPPPPSLFRVGALCKDGTSSTAISSGACSQHDGVSCWKYNDGSCRPN